MEMRLGRKRKADEAILGDSDDEESDEAPRDDEGWDMVDPTHLQYSGKKKATKAMKLAKVMEGRKGRDLTRDRSGGSTNIEKRRKKPVAMVRQKVIRKKSNMTASDKIKGIRKHMKSLKK